MCEHQLWPGLPLIVLAAASLCLAAASLCLAAAPWKAVTDGPDGWRAETPRAEIAPTFSVDRKAKRDAGPILIIKSDGSPAVSGGWAKTFPVTGGKWVRFTARYRARNVELERRSILARVVFQGASGKMIGQAEYPPTTADTNSDGFRTIAADYRVPAKAKTVRVELLLRWSKRGSVRWDSISLDPIAAPDKRPVKVAAVNFRPARRTKGVDDNRDRFSKMIEKACKQKPDVVVVGEGITVVSTGLGYVDVAEPIPGPTSNRLAELSKKHECYIAAGIYERAGNTVYNTAVMTGPGGDIVGTYRKTCLPREEIEGGLTPGSSYPVFDTRFGKVGMMICWDIHFPEVARRLAMNGAELILVPIWGGNELLLRARAVENQVYIATSSYSDKLRTAVWDRRGNALSQAKKQGDIAVAEFDLSTRTMWPWLGDFGGRIIRERPLREAE